MRNVKGYGKFWWYGGMAALCVAVPLQSAFPQTPKCNLGDLDACHTTNQLVWAQGFTDKVEKFLGTEPGNFLYSKPNVLASNDAMEVLGGPPDRPVSVADGMTLFSACRSHSCSEKGAIFFDVPGNVVAIGVAHFACMSGRCDDDYTLTIFIRDETMRVKATSILSNWLNEKRQEEQQTYPNLRIAKIGKVAVRLVRD